MMYKERMVACMVGNVKKLKSLIVSKKGPNIPERLNKRKQKYMKISRVFL